MSDNKEEVELKITTTIKLNNGKTMPVFGLGVYTTEPGDEAYNATVSAIKDNGYKLIDTAAIYKNEESVGKSVIDLINDGTIKREDVFITTKLWNGDQKDIESVSKAIETSLKKLGLKYVDLWLMHFPVTGKRLDSWKVMEEIYEKKDIVKSIGVSNFCIPHLEELLNSCKIKPAVNQIELSPYFTREKLTKYCKDNGIVVTCYSPLTRGKKLKDEKLVKIAKKYEKSTAQILIRWSLQKGYSVIPKSANPKRIKENAEIFDFKISDDDMKALDEFDIELVTCWDPRTTK